MESSLSLSSRTMVVAERLRFCKGVAAAGDIVATIEEAAVSFFWTTSQEAIPDEALLKPASPANFL